MFNIDAVQEDYRMSKSQLFRRAKKLFYFARIGHINLKSVKMNNNLALDLMIRKKFRYNGKL